MSCHVLSQPIENKTKTNYDILACITYAWHWLPVIAPSSDWFIVLTVWVVIGQVIIILLIWFWFYGTQLKTNL